MTRAFLGIGRRFELGTFKERGLVCPFLVDLSEDQSAKPHLAWRTGGPALSAF